VLTHIAIKKLKNVFSKYIYIYVYIYVYICIHICIHMHTYTHMHTHTKVLTHMAIKKLKNFEKILAQQTQNNMEARAMRREAG
jgi:hypothetical protein